MFPVSKCREDWDLGLCPTSVFSLWFCLCSAMAKSDFFCVKTHFFSNFANAQLFSKQLCTDLVLSLLYILILGTYSKFAWKNNFLAHGVCFLQPCSSTGRMFAVSRSHVQNYCRIASFAQQQFRWNMLWTGFHWEWVGPWRANTKRSEIIFQSEFAICFHYQNEWRLLLLSLVKK